MFEAKTQFSDWFLEQAVQKHDKQIKKGGRTHKHTHIVLPPQTTVAAENKDKNKQIK